MLARMFSSPEATSVWIELVTGRKQEIASIYSSGDPLHFQSYAAAEQDFTRGQLAGWDASARSWLLTADDAKSHKQKQLMLIFKNVKVPVNSDTDVFRSVMVAWKSAMKAMESLILGMPQRVHDGAVLLGLSSWHLYPDIVVLGETVASVTFNDPLIAEGACLTVGLQNRDEDEGRGVYWSLSLAHLRYYGEPVTSTRSTGCDPSRVPFSHLELAVLGSVLGGWNGVGDDVVTAAHWFISCWNFMTEDYKTSLDIESDREYSEVMIHHDKERNISNSQPTKFSSCRTGWLELLVRAARALVESKQPAKKEMMMLVKFGQRRGRDFLAQSKHQPPTMFGLSRPRNVLRLMIKSEDRIRLLRRVALEVGLTEGMAVIRYCQGSYGLQKLFEYASPVHHTRRENKRDHKDTELKQQSHARWIGSPHCNCQAQGEDEGKCYSTACPCKKFGIKCTKKCHSNITGRRRCQIFISDSGMTSNTSIVRGRIEKLSQKGEESFGLSSSAIVESKRLRSYSLSQTEDNFNSLEMGFVWENAPICFPPDLADNTNSTKRGNVSFVYLSGDLNTAAIFIRKEHFNCAQNVRIAGWRCGLEELSTMFESRILNSSQLADYLTNLGPKDKTTHASNRTAEGMPSQTYYCSLMALMSASTIYSHLPNATVSMNILSRPLHQALWIPPTATGNTGRESVGFPRYQAFKLDRAQVFACIALFESGQFNIDPLMLRNVMAMSSGNSIYIAKPLLCDPSEIAEPHEIKRIIGNVGRPGIAMLIPPQSPRVRESAAGDTWNVVNHATFDGEPENSFDHTSLHLSFTGYEAPVSLGLHGFQDTEVYLLESNVSVYDRGKWISDLDIIGSLEKKTKLARMRSNCSGEHSHPLPQPPTVKLTSIDSWEELLDSPIGTGIVRAKDNWIGRLTTTVVALQKGHPVHVLERPVCFSCIHLKNVRDTRDKVKRNQRNNILIY